MKENRYISSGLLCDVATFGLRLIPINRHRTFVDAKAMYTEFIVNHSNSYNNLLYSDFLEAFKVVFPLYKNRRKSNTLLKISDYKLSIRLINLGGINVPYSELMHNENLKIKVQ